MTEMEDAKIITQLYFGRGTESVSMLWDSEQPKPLMNGDGWFEMQCSKPIDGVYEAQPDGTWRKSQMPIIKDEQKWAEDQLCRADIEIRYHMDSDSRAVATVSDWRAYRRNLRDYVKNGQIVGERPPAPL